MKNKATVLGLMSGSSLDGLDACLCHFSQTDSRWKFDIIDTKTFELPPDFKTRLQKSAQLGSLDMLALDVDYGKWIGNEIIQMAKSAEIISIHGHTIFHQPSKGFSLQIGSAEQIALITKKLVVSDFRNKDILLGGQGAPLVPMGEKLLFPEFDAFLNLGGICNVSFVQPTYVIAGDIGPFNQVFNHYAQLLGQPMDTNGHLSVSGQLSDALIKQWQAIPYFQQPFPKSLANQWVHENFLNESIHDPRDLMHTYAHFIADQLSEVINRYQTKRLLVTGGGAYHDFVMNLLREKCHAGIVKPESELVNHKEALIFALLGLLRVRKEINVLSSSTGASRDSCSGVIYQP